MIGITWYLLLYCVYDITYRLSIHFIFKAISGGLLMLGYDLVLEPVAIKMPMWQWDSESVPIKNYLAWFLISFFILLIMHLLKIKYRNKVSLFMFIVQFMFMLILNFTL